MRVIHELVRIRQTGRSPINGAVRLLWAPRGHLLRVITFVVTNGKITEVNVIADPAQLRGFDSAIVD